MLTMLSIVIPIAAAAVLLAGALRYLLRSWLDYRVRVALLHALESRPELLAETDGDALSLPAQSDEGRVDYLVTGTALAFIGLGCVLAGWVMRVGQLAVGVYLGGILCLCLGFLLAVLGFLVRRMDTGRYAKE